MIPEINDKVAVAYADQYGKTKEVKCGYIINIFLDYRNMNVYKIRITSGEKQSTIHISEMDRHRFMTLKEIENGKRDEV
jgi:hypothetical protein